MFSFLAKLKIEVYFLITIISVVSFFVWSYNNKSDTIDKLKADAAVHNVATETVIDTVTNLQAAGDITANTNTTVAIKLQVAITKHEIIKKKADDAILVATKAMATNIETLPMNEATQKAYNDSVSNIIIGSLWEAYCEAASDTCIKAIPNT